MTQGPNQVETPALYRWTPEIALQTPRLSTSFYLVMISTPKQFG